MTGLTVMTPDGRRHIPHGDKIGYRDIEHPRPPTIDGGSTPLLWRPSLQAAEYNRNPGILAFVVKLPCKPDRRWKVILDPEDKAPEIYKGNNTVTFEDLDDRAGRPCLKSSPGHAWHHPLRLRERDPQIRLSIRA